MTELFNLKYQKSLRKNLRQQGVIAETILWSKLRNKNLGYKFKRQFGIEKYIVDFYCPRKKLVIEIDGATHSTNSEILNDRIRQKYLEYLGLKIIRFTNNDIRENMDGVLSKIVEICKELTFPNPSFVRRGNNPPPCEGGVRGGG
ncbi:MAG: endonuclease domain-containing protein [Patescibacteria group bacterium]